MVGSTILIVILAWGVGPRLCYTGLEETIGTNNIFVDLDQAVTTAQARVAEYLENSPLSLRDSLII